MPLHPNDKALVVLSGGQDSTTCLGLALDKYQEVHAISFRYNQRHAVELHCARDICDKYKVPIKIIELDFFGKMITSALTGCGSVSEKHIYKKDLPASFVPNRNALFLTLAHAYAQELSIGNVYMGMCQTDYSGYPDCRESFINDFNDSLNLGYQTVILFHTPLMNLTKAETFALAESIGFLHEIIYETHTCYNGDRNNVHAWGYGCGKCPACELRAKGWNEFKASKKAVK